MLGFLTTAQISLKTVLLIITIASLTSSLLFRHSGTTILNRRKLPATTWLVYLLRTPGVRRLARGVSQKPYRILPNESRR